LLIFFASLFTLSLQYLESLGVAWKFFHFCESRTFVKVYVQSGSEDIKQRTRTKDAKPLVFGGLSGQRTIIAAHTKDNEYGGRLLIHVRCLLDEFANIGQIPKSNKLITTIRSREISACVILQAQRQLKAICKDNAETIRTRAASTGENDCESQSARRFVRSHRNNQDTSRFDRRERLGGT
jgi:hypothetical protein